MTTNASLGDVLHQLPKRDAVQATEQIDLALRCRTGHIAVFGTDADMTTMVVNFVLARAGGFELLNVSALQGQPRPAVTTPGLNGKLVAVVKDANAASAGELEQLRLWAEARPASLGRIRLLLIGSENLETTLAQSGAAVLASRVQSRVWLPYRYLHTYTAPAVVEAKAPIPPRLFISAAAQPDEDSKPSVFASEYEALTNESLDTDDASVEEWEIRTKSARRGRPGSRSFKRILAYAASICFGIHAANQISANPQMSASISEAAASVHELIMEYGPEAIANLSVGFEAATDFVSDMFGGWSLSTVSSAHAARSGSSRLYRERYSATRVFVDGAEIETQGATLETLLMVEGLAARQAARVNVVGNSRGR